MKGLHLGCGPRAFLNDSRWVNADIIPDPNFDVVMDAQNPWPFPENTFDQFLANHVGEHCLDIFHFIKEMWRVCKCGAFAQVNVPIFSWPDFWDDPTHRSCWTPKTFQWFIQGHPSHIAFPFRHIEFIQKRYEFRGGFELSWDLEVIKPGIPKCAEPPIELPANAYNA